LTKSGQTERKQRKDWTTKTEQRTRKTSWLKQRENKEADK
jgi:hypothetical protein